jgi:protein SCO1/2
MSSGKTLVYGIVAAIALALGALAGVLWLAPGSPGLQSATALVPPRRIESLSLVDQDGRAFTLDSLRGHWSIVFPGFTSCPDVCPTTLALLKQVSAAIDERQRPQVVFLSVDPGRDTPQRLRDYVRYFDPRFQGVTAPEPALAAAAQALGVAYVRVPGATPEDYTMDHSAMLILIDPQAQIAAYFLPPHRLDALLADLKKLMEGT